jgi:DNA-binding NarL/FixJ family response regulator
MRSSPHSAPGSARIPGEPRPARGDADAQAELARAIWRGVVEGSWTLVERVDRDGRCLLLVRRGSSPRKRGGLTALERRIVGFAALGCSNKHAASELEVAESTITKHVQSALRTLGLKSRAELIRMLDTEIGAGPEAEIRFFPRGLEGSSFRLGGDDFAWLSLRLPKQPKLPSGLTPAEEEVVIWLLEGKSNSEIARARGVTASTVANQIQTVFRKLGVGSRWALMHLCRGD